MAKRKWLLQRTIKQLEKAIVIDQKIIYTKQKMIEALKIELKKEI